MTHVQDQNHKFSVCSQHLQVCFGASDHDEKHVLPKMKVNYKYYLFYIYTKTKGQQRNRRNLSGYILEHEEAGTRKIDDAQDKDHHLP